MMIVVDRLSKRVYSIPCHKTITSEGSARLFKDTVWRHEGFPETVLSDRGPQFVSEFTREPQTDGQTERVNQEIEQYFRIFVNAQMNDWVSWLPIAEHSNSEKTTSRESK
jgi:hypothetical protein